MPNKSNYFFIATLLTAPFLLHGCGGKIDPSQASTSGSHLEFGAQLTPVNKNFANSADSGGNAVVAIEGDHVDYSVLANGLDPNSTYKISIHRGDRCPNVTAGDGNPNRVIDEAEGNSVYGPAIVDFGSNAHSDAAASDLASSESPGTINFHNSGSFNDVLKAIPANESSGASGNGNQAFEHRVVVINGVNTTQPGASFPALCGRLELIAAAGTGTTTGTSTSTSTGTGNSTGQQQQQTQEIGTISKTGTSAQQTQATGITQQQQQQSTSVKTSGAISTGQQQTTSTVSPKTSPSDSDSDSEDDSDWPWDW